MKDKNRPIGVMNQIYILAAIVVLVVGGITYFTQRLISNATVREDTTDKASDIAEEVTMAVHEYPAYEWLIRYWYQNAGNMRIEYDAEYNRESDTEKKCRELSMNYPGLQLKYATESQIRAMSDEDQKLYAEIAYAWLTNRINQIKRSFDVDYLFCVLTDVEGEDAYQMQFFLFSGSDPGAKRGTNYEEVYPLGTTVSVRDNKDQQYAMRKAVEYAEEEKQIGYLAPAGHYVDYYDYVDMIDGKAVLVGLTYDFSGIQMNIRMATWRSTSLAIIFQLLLLFLIMRHLVLYVLQPLKEVQHNIRQYKETKNSEEVIRNLTQILNDRSARAIRRNEIGELSEDVMSLAREVDDYITKIETITAEEERIQTELTLAAQIQTAMLPSAFPAFPERTEFDIFAIMDPAKEVGGDFYDFFLIDEDHLGVVMADVSGKGIPAALFMMISKVILQSVAMLGTPVEEILKKTNEALCSNNQTEMFVTAWVGILEISTGKLIAANAGHEYPMLMKNGKFEAYKDRHGFVLGGMETSRYHAYTIQLEPGDTLFVYTDGVVEANNAQQELFGMQRLLEVLNQEPEASCEKVIENVKNAVEYFEKDEVQFDDLTMLCLKYKGRS